MDNNEMLELIRKDRPKQVINEVVSFYKNEYGFYDVIVDMESGFFGVTVKHTKTTLPYPLEEFNKLTVEQRDDYVWDKH